MPAARRCTIVPPYLLRRIARDDDHQAAASARRTIERDAVVRDRRTTVAERTGRHPKGLLPSDLVRRARELQPGEAPEVAVALPVQPQRAVHDAKHDTELPGVLVRAEGDGPVDDIAVNETYDALGATWNLLWKAYRRNSLDGKGLALVATVHYDERYDNAFWDGAQMVFGDGDGVYFDGFTSSVDVVGHELAHGLTQYTAGLTYVAQPGALGESVSDVFGSLTKQMQRGQPAAAADWLIGEGLFTERVNGVALRSMRAPGTAYDDSHLGRDPQPADMDGYVDLPHDGENDNGGVHVNSGIPNRAFYLAATTIGGYAWEGAGQIWYDTITARGVPKDVDFAGFAERTVAAAQKRHGGTSRQAGAVREAWAQVKVL